MLILPEDDRESPDYFSVTQLVLIFTDVRNWLDKNKNGNLEEKIDFQKFVTKLHFRSKHNDIGYMTYLCDKWASLTCKELELVLVRICEEDAKFIKFSTFALVLTLLRYPMPTNDQIASLMEDLDKEEMSFDDYLNVATWMDQFDEKLGKFTLLMTLVADLSKQSTYRTAFTKKLLFWIFMDTETQKLNVERFIDTLRKFSNSGGMRTFSDYLFDE